MNLEKIKQTINSSQYNFLRNDPSLGNNLCLLTLGGSYAYGTNVDTPEHTSDLDIRGIYTNSKREILTMNCLEKPFEDEDTDTVIYPLKQIIKLLIAANPNTVEILGTKEEHLLYCTETGRMLRNNMNLFLSRKVIESFGGYSFQQLKRLENALMRNSNSLDAKEENILKSINRKILSMKDRYKQFTGKEINLYIDKSDKSDLNTEIFMDLNLTHYPLRDFKNVYNEMNSTIRDYDKLNHRNNKKDEVHLLKHAMHLIRLQFMFIEIATTGKVNTYRENERQLLLDIRNGKYTYEEIFAIVNELDKQVEDAIKNIILPAEPDYKKIDELIIEINKIILAA
jgi:predicted nucleotidyltransferase